MTEVTVTLPFEKETPGALKYAVEDVRSQAVGAVYVRKDKLRDAGHKGLWPSEITLTIKVEEETGGRKEDQVPYIYSDEGKAEVRGFKSVKEMKAFEARPDFPGWDGL
jgi:hypothetical protein